MSITLNGTTGITTPDIDSVAAPDFDGSNLTGIAPFKPVAVSGTTPSLNVGTYNFFKQGALTANTTVSFASVPTESRWSYSFVPTVVSDTWDVSSAYYSQSFPVGAQDTVPLGLFFKPDGTKMYFIGTTGDNVYEYDLRLAWDTSTASYLQLFSLSAQDTAPAGIFFKPDGLKMYVTGATNDSVYEYDLSTAWNISTAVYLQVLSVTAQEINPYGVSFKPDGLKMYVMGSAGDDVNEYDLSTAWNVTTAVFLQSFSVAAQDTGPLGLFFKPDGLKMYVAGTTTGDNVYEYNLSTAWDVSSASYLQLFYVGFQDVSPIGLFFKPDGTRMYFVGADTDSVYEYDLGTNSTVTLPAAVENTPAQRLRSSTQVTYEFITLDGGTTVTLIGEEVV